MSWQSVCLVFLVTLAGCLAGQAEERIVYPRLLEGRGHRGEKMLYVHDGLTLSLEKSRVFADNFVLTVDDGAKQTDKIVDGKTLGTNLYRDVDGTAALQVEDVDGTVQVRGFIEHRLSIEPLPLAARSDDGRVAHKVSELADETTYALFDDIAPDQITSHASSLHVAERKGKKSLPGEFLVETRLISDHYHNEGKTEKEQIAYYGERMNLVNHHFKMLTSPRVQFLTVGLVLSKVEPYARVGVDTKKNRMATLLYDTLKYLVETLNRTGQHKQQDAVVFNTGLVPATTLRKDGTVQYGLLGVAPVVGGVCSMYGVTTLATQKTNPQGSSRLIAHELAHVVGVSDNGGWKARRCPRDGDGYLMGNRGKKAFSKCDVEELGNTLRRLKEDCFKLTAGPFKI